jgi:predicted metal-dependent peptidase
MIEINQYIDKAFLPPNPQLPEVYPELNLEPKRGTQYYYDKLMEGAKNPGTCPNLDKMLGAGDGDGEGQIKVTVSINGKGEVEVEVPNHDTWSEFENLDEATKKLIKTQTEHIIKEVVEKVEKSRGTVPAEMKEIIEKLSKLEPPKFNWRGYLRRFIGGSVKTYTKMSRHKPNFRFIENPGLKHKHKRKILVAVDTSGSVSTDELIEFLNEINHIQRTGTEVIIVQCDTAISYIGKFNPKENFNIHGRGGTNFHPVTDYYDENHKKFNCLIYLTDGEAPAPEKCKGPVLWVISSKSPSINPDLKGFQIQLN